MAKSKLYKQPGNFNAGWEVRNLAPLDDRGVVDTKDALYLPATWLSSDGSYYHYKGMMVVAADTGKLYIYKGKSGDTEDVALSDNWVSPAGITGDYVERVSALPDIYDTDGKTLLRPKGTVINNTTDGKLYILKDTLDITEMPDGTRVTYTGEDQNYSNGSLTLWSDGGAEDSFYYSDGGNMYSAETDRTSVTSEGDTYDIYNDQLGYYYDDYNDVLYLLYYYSGSITENSEADGTVVEFTDYSRYGTSYQNGGQTPLEYSDGSYYYLDAASADPTRIFKFNKGKTKVFDAAHGSLVESATLKWVELIEEDVCVVSTTQKSCSYPCYPSMKNDVLNVGDKYLDIEMSNGTHIYTKLATGDGTSVTNHNYKIIKGSDSATYSTTQATNALSFNTNDTLYFEDGIDITLTPSSVVEGAQSVLIKLPDNWHGVGHMTSSIGSYSDGSDSDLTIDFEFANGVARISRIPVNAITAISYASSNYPALFASYNNSNKGFILDALKIKSIVLHVSGYKKSDVGTINKITSSGLSTAVNIPAVLQTINFTISGSCALSSASSLSGYALDPKSVRYKLITTSDVSYVLTPTEKEWAENSEICVKSTGSTTAHYGFEIDATYLPNTDKQCVVNFINGMASGSLGLSCRVWKDYTSSGSTYKKFYVGLTYANGNELWASSKTYGANYTFIFGPGYREYFDTRTYAYNISYEPALLDAHVLGANSYQGSAAEL